MHPPITPALLVLTLGCAAKGPAQPQPQPQPSVPATTAPADHSATATPNVETPPSTPTGAEVIEAKTPEAVRAAVGQTVRVVGFPINSKASPRLNLEGGGVVYCRIGSTHWPDEYAGKKVVVTGEVIQLAGPIYPVATQDEDGAWSQGVGVPMAALAADIVEPAQAPPAVAVPSTSDDVVIQVAAHALAP